MIIEKISDQLRCTEQIAEGHLQVQIGAKITSVFCHFNVTYFVTDNFNLHKIGSLGFTKKFLKSVNDMYSAADYVSRKAKLVVRQVGITQYF